MPDAHTLISCDSPFSESRLRLKLLNEEAHRRRLLNELIETKGSSKALSLLASSITSHFFYGPAFAGCHRILSCHAIASLRSSHVCGVCQQAMCTRSVLVEQGIIAHHTPFPPVLSHCFASIFCQATSVCSAVFARPHPRPRSSVLCS